MSGASTSVEAQLRKCGKSVKIVFATRNKGKLRELSKLLQLAEVDFISLADLPLALSIEENGATFAENAKIKALATMEATGLPALADDSGLEVDALGGEPGIHSARYAGDGASDAERIAFLLQKLKDVPMPERNARFRCVAAFADPKALGYIHFCEGSCEGHILTGCRGNGGFGYDPIFYAKALGQTFAEAPAEAKNRVSHRGQAMLKMAAYLTNWLSLKIFGQRPD